jgi:anti-anti-sigma factor
VLRAEDCYRCTVQRHGRMAEIMLAGELDLAADRALDAAIDGALDAIELDEVSIDLGLVGFAQSTTLAWLVRADDRIRSRGARMTVSDCSTRMGHLLRLTGMDAQLTFSDARRRP